MDRLQAVGQLNTEYRVTRSQSVSQRESFGEETEIGGSSNSEE